MAVLFQIAFLLAGALPPVLLAAPYPSSVEQRGLHNWVMGPDHPLTLARRNLTVARRSTDYTQDYTTGGTVDFTPGNGEFSLSWNTDDDFVVGVGWNPGSTQPISFDGSFTIESGLGSLGVYGWTTNPLVEYYITEDQTGIPYSGTHKGTVESDGGTYTIWESQRVNEPSIEGTSTFNQYISVRQSPRTSGTVTVENHFKAWAAAGMNLGTFNFQVISVESWQGSGTAKQSVAQGSSSNGGSTSTALTTKPPSATTSPTSTHSGSAGSAAAHWAQCGGQGWTGPTACQSPYTCKAANAYYSQCL